MMLASEEYSSTIAFLATQNPEAAQELAKIQMQDIILYDLKPQWNQTAKNIHEVGTDLAKFQSIYDMFKNLRMMLEKFQTIYNLSQNEVLLEIHAGLFYPIDEVTQSMVNYVITEGYRRFRASSVTDTKNKDDNQCSICAEGSCVCQSMVRIFSDLCFEVAPLSLPFVERLFGDLPMQLVRDSTKERIMAVFSQNEDKPYHTMSFKAELEHWMSVNSCLFLQKVYGSFNDVADCNKREIRLYMYEVYGKAIIERLLFISLHYPTCHNIITDLITCMDKVPLRKVAVKTLSKKVKAELLNLGVNSTQILTAYIHFVKCLRVVDPTGVFVDSVCHPIRQYLRQRSDTVRCIVSFLTDSEFSRLNLKQELEKEECNSDDDMDENVYSWMQWKPDPIDADPTRTRRSRKSADLLTMLVSVYGSKQLFVKEYAQLLADRLLKTSHFDTHADDTGNMVSLERQCLTLLKKRFGEADLLQCEVMLKDIAESTKLHSSILMSPEYRFSTPPNKNEIKLSSRICSTHFWPKMRDEKLELPIEIQQLQEKYKRGYESLKSNRTLEFFPTQGSVSVELEIGSETRKLTVTPLIASVLNCFTEKDCWSMDALSTKLKLPPSLLRRKINAWTSKTGLLVETTPNSHVWTIPLTFPPPTFGQNTDTTFNKLASHLSHSEGVTEHVSAEESEESSGDESEDEGADSVIEEQLEMRWKYIQQLLRTCQTLAAERLLSLVRMMTSPGKQPTLDNVNRFLQKKCREGLLVQHNNLYKLPPKK